MNINSGIHLQFHVGDSISTDYNTATGCVVNRVIKNNNRLEYINIYISMTPI